eukprot:TRINITY_DN35409_c0_g1_i1.p1 TRINITY_DN35409_c0_g1~~TRINITY_DN35409_c0_g1_i1.p1  ORF type:complete len:395 (+),score=-92.19 TRINITY_DN35409_c0_g1_i1:112-1296(+)
MSERTVEVWNNDEDRIALNNNNFNFQFAKSVVGRDGKLEFNIVWQSCGIAPRTSITWKPVYGLNWTLSLPKAGVAVSMGGIWKQCDLGKSYDISKQGIFVPSVDSQLQPKPDYLNIGKNNFRYNDTTHGIHILVGLKNSAGNFEVIYVDPIELGVNMSSFYQPQEKCQWWYETGVRTGTMIAGADTPIHEYDMSESNPETGIFYVATTYHYNTGVWEDRATEPPSIYEFGLAQNAGKDRETYGKELKLLNDKMTQLEQMLSSFLKGSLSAGSQNGSFVGTIIWPANTAVNVRVEGIQAVCQYLNGQGYSAADEWNESTNTSTIEFYLNGSPEPPGISLRDRTIWDNAFATIPEGGPRNGGLDRLTTHQQSSGRKAQAKEVMGKRLNGYQELIHT